MWKTNVHADCSRRDKASRYHITSPKTGKVIVVSGEKLSVLPKPFDGLYYKLTCSHGYEYCKGTCSVREINNRISDPYSVLLTLDELKVLFSVKE